MGPPVAPAKALPKKARKSRAKKEEPQPPLDMTAFYKIPKAKTPQNNQSQQYQAPGPGVPGGFHPQPAPAAPQQGPLQQPPPLAQRGSRQQPPQMPQRGPMPQRESMQQRRSIQQPPQMPQRGPMQQPSPMPQRGPMPNGAYQPQQVPFAGNQGHPSVGGSMQQGPRTMPTAGQMANQPGLQSAGYPRSGGPGPQHDSRGTGPATGAPQFGYPYARPQQPLNPGYGDNYSPSLPQYPQRHGQQSGVPPTALSLAGRKRSSTVIDISDDDADTPHLAKKSRTECDILKSDSVQPEAALDQGYKDQSLSSGQTHNPETALQLLEQTTGAPEPLIQHHKRMSSTAHPQDQAAINMPIGDLNPAEAETAMRLALGILRAGRAVASVRPGEVAVSVPEDSVVMYLPPDSSIAFYGRADATILWKEVSAISFSEGLSACQQHQALEMAGVPRHGIEVAVRDRSKKQPMDALAQVDVSNDLFEGRTLIDDHVQSDPAAIPEHPADTGTNKGGDTADSNVHPTSSPAPAQHVLTKSDVTVAAAPSNNDFRLNTTDDNQQGVAQTEGSSLTGITGDAAASTAESVAPSHIEPRSDTVQANVNAIQADSAETTAKEGHSVPTSGAEVRTHGSDQSTIDFIPLPTTGSERATYWARKRELEDRKRELEDRKQREQELYEAELDAEFEAQQEAEAENTALPAEGDQEEENPDWLADMLDEMVDNDNGEALPDVDSALPDIEMGDVEEWNES